MPTARKAAPATRSFDLDHSAIERAKKSLDDGVVTPALRLPKEQLIKHLNDSLATELVCVLRYRRHHFTIEGAALARIKEELLVHSKEEQAHADRIAERIVQLGGSPNFKPSSLEERSHADYDDHESLEKIVRSNLSAERGAIETYRQLIALIGDQDPTTRHMLTEILADEEEHADELKDWMTLK